MSIKRGDYIVDYRFAGKEGVVTEVNNEMVTYESKGKEQPPVHISMVEKLPFRSFWSQLKRKVKG